MVNLDVVGSASQRQWHYCRYSIVSSISVLLGMIVICSRSSTAFLPGVVLKRSAAYPSGAVDTSTICSTIFHPYCYYRTRRTNNFFTFQKGDLLASMSNSITNDTEDDEKLSPSSNDNDDTTSVTTYVAPVEVVVAPPTSPLLVQKIQEMTLPQLWEALDRRRLSYRTTSSRKELETILLQSYHPAAAAATTATSLPKRRRRRRSNNNRRIVTMQPFQLDQLWDPSSIRRRDLDFSNTKDIYYVRRPRPRPRPSQKLDVQITTVANQTIYDEDSTTRDLKSTARNTKLYRSTIPSTAMQYRHDQLQRRRKVAIHPPRTNKLIRNLSKNNWADKFIQSVDLLLGIDDPYYRRRIPTKDTKVEKGKEEEEEEEDTNNMLSMVLFGQQNSNKKRLSWRNKIPFFPSNSQTVCTSTLSTVLQLSLVGIANLCRWATVQGTLPQPLVVFTLLSSVLAARRKRFLVGAATIIALRTMGEIVSSSTQDSVPKSSTKVEYYPPEQRRRRRRRNDMLLPSSSRATIREVEDLSTSPSAYQKTKKKRQLSIEKEGGEGEKEEEEEDKEISLPRIRRRRKNSDTDNID